MADVIDFPTRPANDADLGIVLADDAFQAAVIDVQAEFLGSMSIDAAGDRGTADVYRAAREYLQAAIRFVGERELIDSCKPPARADRQPTPGGSMTDIRQHRVKAFADWLDTIPPNPPFHTRPEFKFYADLSDAEFDAAEAEMRERGRAAQVAADALSAQHPSPLGTVDLLNRARCVAQVAVRGSGLWVVALATGGAAELLIPAKEPPIYGSADDAKAAATKLSGESGLPIVELEIDGAPGLLGKARR